MKLNFLLALIPALLIGCSNSTNYTYHQKSTSLKKGSTHYFVKDPIVNLTLGHGAIVGDKTFVSQEVLAEQFKSSLIESFSNNNIYAANEADADAVVEVKINYLRTFNYGGKALNKPQFDYQVLIKKDNNLLADYAVARQTTTYGAIKDVAVNMKISAFQWGAEDEQQDVALIAKTIAKEVAKIGK